MTCGYYHASGLTGILTASMWLQWHIRQPQDRQHHLDFIVIKATHQNSAYKTPTGYLIPTVTGEKLTRAPVWETILDNL